MSEFIFLIIIIILSILAIVTCLAGLVMFIFNIKHIIIDSKNRIIYLYYSKGYTKEIKL